MALSVGEIQATLTLRDQMSAALKTAQKNLQTAGKSIERMGQQMSTAGSAMLPLSAAVSAFGYVALDTFADFEKGMNRVRAVTGATGTDFAALDKQAQQLGATTVFTAREAAEAMGFLGLAGFKVNEILGAMPGTLQLASAGAMDVGRAADITAKVLRGYGFDVAEISRVNDVLVKSFTTANTDLVQLGDAFRYAGPIAKLAGMQFEETSAALSLMADAGFQSTMGGTALRGAISRLSGAVPAVTKQLKALGIEALDPTTGKMKPLVDVLRMLEKAGLDTAQVMQLFGQRAGPAMGALIERGSVELEAFTKKLVESGGTADRIANIQLEGLKGKFVLLESAVEGAMIAIGKALSPSVTPVVEKLTDWANAVRDKVVPEFQAMPKSVQTATAAILAMVAVAAPALIGLGAVIRGVGFALGGLGIAAGGVAKLTGVFSGIAAFFTGSAWSSAILGTSALTKPLRFLIDSIMALGLRVGIEQTAIRAWSIIMKGAGAAIGAVVSPIGLLISAFAALAGGLRWVTGSWGFLTDPLKKAYGLFTDIWLVVTTKLKPAIDDISTIISGALSPAFSGFLDMLESVRVKLLVVYEVQKAVWNLGFKWVFGDVQEDAKQIRALNEKAEALDRLRAALAGVSGGKKQMPGAQFFLPRGPSTPAETGGNGGGMGEEIKELADMLSGKALAKEVADLTAAFKSLGVEEQAVAIHSGRLGKELESLAASGAVLDATFQAEVDRQAQVKKGWNAIIVIMGAMRAAKISGAAENQKYLDSEIATAQAIVEAKQGQFTAALDAARKASSEFAKLNMTDTEKAIYEAGRQRDESLKAIAPLEKLLPAIYENARMAIDAIYDSMVSDAREAGRDVVTSFSSTLAGLPQVILGALQGGGGVTSAIASSLGSGLFAAGGPLNNKISSGLYSLANKVGGRFPAELATSMAKMLPGVGAVIGPVLANLGKKLIGSFFGTAGRDEVTKFGATFAGGINGLRQKLLPLGEEGERLWKTLTQGVGKNNPEEAKKAIEAVTAALAKEEERVKSLREEMSKLAAEGGLASAALIAFRNANPMDQDVMAFALSQVQAAGTAVGKMLDAMQRSATASAKRVIEQQIKGVEAALAAAEANGLSGSEIDALELQLEALKKKAEEVQGTFKVTATGAAAMANILLASFDGTAQSLRDMEPALLQLQRAMQASGIEGSAAFNQIVSLARLATDEVTGPMIDAINEGTKALTAMYNAGFLTQETFQGIVTEVMAQRAALLAAGATADQVNAIMQKDLQRIWELMQDGKFEVDATTKALIDEAVAQGKVGDQFRSSTDRMVRALERLADMFETVFGDELAAAAKRGADAAQAEIDRIRGGTVTVDVEYNDPGYTPRSGTGQGPGGGSGGGGRPPIEMARGGYGTVDRPTLFMAGEAGREDFAFSGAGKSFGGGGGDQTIVVQVGQDAILRTVVKGLPRYLKVRGGR